MAQARSPFAAGAAPASLAGEPPPKSRRTALRVGIGMFLLLAIAGVATTLIVNNEVGGLVNAFKKTAKTINVSKTVLAPTYRGGAQTLLLVGNDQRSSQEVLPHSNEMLLVRIDPSKPTISMLSIPRELRVTFRTPYGAYETNRFNSAYTFGWVESKSKHSVSGGIKLMLETIKKTLGLSVNQVFVVDFKNFEHAIEEMGCVYFPVDRHYDHSNTEPNGEPSPEQYFEIHLHAGYQNLCGEEALEYVANRHESTSIVRDARDQRFVLEVKKQYGSRIFAEREKFEHILGKDVQSTLKAGGEEAILNLLYLVAESAGKPVRQVHFPLTSLGDEDTASEAQIHAAATSFLSGTKAITHKRVTSALNTAKARKKNRHASVEPSMQPTSEEALTAARQEAPNLPFPLEYPRIRNALPGAEPDELRVYNLHSPNRVGHKSYVIVIDRGLLGQYYDVQGTTWKNPPILSKPSDEIHIGHRDYMLFYSGEHIVTVAWREGKAVYWVENTLSNNVSPRQMIEIAEETQPVDRVVNTAPAKRAREATTALKEVARQDPNAGKKRLEAVAIIVGAACLLAMLALAAMLLLRRRELRTLREQIEQAVAIEARPATAAQRS